jgi:hypothetical protein
VQAGGRSLDGVEPRAADVVDVREIENYVTALITGGSECCRQLRRSNAPKPADR